LEIVEADALTELGATYLELGAFPQALEALEAGLRIAVRYPTERREPRLLKLRGKVLVATGRPAEARETWQRAVVLYKREADAGAEEVERWLSEL
jgi:tetratricopeptide (TPR) repeat protein